MARGDVRLGADGRLTIFDLVDPPMAEPGDVIVSLVDPKATTPGEAGASSGSASGISTPADRSGRA